MSASKTFSAIDKFQSFAIATAITAYLLLFIDYCIPIPGMARFGTTTNSFIGWISFFWSYAPYILFVPVGCRTIWRMELASGASTHKGATFLQTRFWLAIHSGLLLPWGLISTYCIVRDGIGDLVSDGPRWASVLLYLLGDSPFVRGTIVIVHLLVLVPLAGLCFTISWGPLLLLFDILHKEVGPCPATEKEMFENLDELKGEGTICELIWDRMQACYTCKAGYDARRWKDRRLFGGKMHC